MTETEKILWQALRKKQFEDYNFRRKIFYGYRDIRYLDVLIKKFYVIYKMSLKN